MQITLYSTIMAILWSSILISFFYLLRTRFHAVEVCSITGTIIIYLFCAVRTLFPMEFSWTKVISGGIIWKFIFYITSFELFSFYDIHITVSLMLLLIWFVVAIISITKVFKKYHAVISNFSDMNSIDIESTPYKVIFTNKVSSPCCIGIRNPKILLPDQDYEGQAFEYIILHETAHIKNHDNLIRLLIDLLCSIYWWNPIMGLLKKDLSQSLEIRCDQAVIRHLSESEQFEYLRTILDVFKGITSVSAYDYSSGFAHSPVSSIEERFHIIANAKPITSITRAMISLIIAAVIFAFSYLFIVQPRFAPPNLRDRKWRRNP